MQSIWVDGIVSIVLFTFHPIRQICSINLIFIIEKHQQLFVTTNMRLTVTFLVAIFPFEGHLFFINSFRCDAPHCMPTITYFTFGRTDFFSHENILLLYAFSESMNNIKCNDRFKVCTFRMWNMRAFQYHACFNTFKMKNQQQTGCVECVSKFWAILVNNICRCRSSRILELMLNFVPHFILLFPGKFWL